VITPATPFTPITLDANVELLDLQLQYFFGTSGLAVDNIVAKTTIC
jgi:hypothetical protein